MATTVSKQILATALGVTRQSLYYQHVQDQKDWETKILIEQALHERPAYGHKRLAIKLGINKKRVLRVMKVFGIKPYRRHGKKYKKVPKNKGNVYPNLLLTTMPQYPHHIWACDFTHLSFHGRTIYVATVIDLFTRQLVGYNVLKNHSTDLIIPALQMAVWAYGTPEILHSDQGSEYTSHLNISMLKQIGVVPSMSRAGCPWENGYQESFYDKFKIDLGDPGRFDTIGELTYAVYQTMVDYNTGRIHTSIGMPPQKYAILNASLSINQPSLS